MSSFLPLDYDTLLAPISAEAPTGAPVTFDINEYLKDARIEVDPDAEGYASDDPMRPEPKKADWNGIASKCLELLTQSSKDLMITARLTEALARLDGFSGLRASLHLFNRLLDVYWDQIHPQIEEGDVGVRAKAFNWLDDPDLRGVYFPNTVRSLPLVISSRGAYSYTQWQNIDKPGGITKDDFEQAVQAAVPERCAAVLEDITQCLTELQQISQRLQEKMGGEAPGMTGLQQPLGECYSLAKQIVQRRPASGAGSGEGAGAVEGDGEVAAGTGRRLAATRDEAYRQLVQAAEVLRGLEPHSPIPYLIQRAVELGSMPFPQLIKTLIRDPNVLAELTREFGLPAE